ncbi:MAG: type II toxin-antitoxin system HicB family antitoxin, partial [Acidobacteriota bacterium]|nr:type II toxin-antitoxin system HicB family antitoxin [Acidobacteriota bacterium]
PETGRYSSVFPELPGCASAGDTEEEAIANAREALKLWFVKIRRIGQACLCGDLLNANILANSLTQKETEHYFKVQGPRRWFGASVSKIRNEREPNFLSLFQS